MPVLKLHEWEVAMADHRRALDRLTGPTAMRSLKRAYDSAVAELEARLGRVLRGVGVASDSMTALQYRALLAQAKQGARIVAQRMAGETGELSRQAAQESIRGLARTMTRLESKYQGAAVTLPIEESAQFWGVVEGRATSVMRLHQTSMARYGARRVAQIEEALGLSLATGESGVDAVDRVVGVMGGAEWEAERIARSETAWAYSAVAADGIKVASEELPDLMMRWSEHADDSSGAPLDDRTSVDSLALHGQVAPPGGRFTQPATSPVPDAEGKTKVPKGLVDETFEFPPSRPNCRAALQPWRPHWGIPGWMWRGGRRVPVRAPRAESED